MTTPVAPTREIIVRSFQPSRRRAAAHKGRHAGRTEHVVFLHFGDTAVAPQRGNRQKRSDEPGLAGHYRGRRQPLLSHREPSEDARRRKERHPLHHDGIGARLLLCGADFAERTTLARMNFKNRLHHAERFVTIVGPGGSDNAGGRNRAPADGRNFFRPLTDVAKERSDDEHAKRD